MGDRTEFLSDQILKWLLYKLLVNYEVNDEIEGNFGGAHARIRGTLGVYHMQDCTFLLGVPTVAIALSWLGFR